MLAGSGQRRAVASVRVAGYLPADGMNAPQRSHGLHDDDSDLLVRAVRSEPELSAKVDALFSSLMGRVGELRSSKLVQNATVLHSHVRRQLLWVSESLKSGKSRAPSGPEAVVTAKGRSALAAARRMAERARGLRASSASPARTARDGLSNVVGDGPLRGRWREPPPT